MYVFGYGKWWVISPEEQRANVIIIMSNVVYDLMLDSK